MISTAMRQVFRNIRAFLLAIVCATAMIAFAQPVDHAAHWDRYLEIGTAFYFEGQSDSAKVYLERVFENDAEGKVVAARYLLDMAINEGDTPKINEYALYLAENYDVSIDQERQKSQRRLILIVAAALLVLLILGGVTVVLYRRHKREEEALLEQQQREREAYDRQLDAAQTTLKEQAQVHLVRQTHEIYSHGNPRKRILEAFHAAYPHAYERLKAAYPDLSEQECDLLVLNFLEFRIKEEAEILELSQNTVMKYRSNLLKKVGKEPIAGLLG